MDLMARLENKAAGRFPKVVYPEGAAPEIAAAAAEVLARGIARPVLIGRPEEIVPLRPDMEGIGGIDPAGSPLVAE